MVAMSPATFVVPKLKAPSEDAKRLPPTSVFVRLNESPLTAKSPIVCTFAKETAPEPPSIPALPVTVKGPVWVTPPEALVAARSPPAVVVPRFKAPPAVAVTSPPTVDVPKLKAPPAVVVRFPVVLIGPSVSAPVSAIATEPLIG